MSPVTVNVNRSEVHSIHDTASFHLQKSELSVTYFLKCKMTKWL